MHRDPVKALASRVDLVGTTNWMRSDHPLMGGAFDQHTNAQLVNGMLCQPIGWLEEGIVPKDQVLDIQFRDFRADALATVERIYAALDLELSPTGRAAIQAYQDSTPFRRYSYDVGPTRWSPTSARPSPPTRRTSGWSRSSAPRARGLR